MTSLAHAAAEVQSAVDFSVWLLNQSRALRAAGDPRSIWLAAKVAELHRLTLLLRAGDPETFDDRLEVLERDR